MGGYLRCADLASRDAHLLVVPQLDGEDDLVVARPDRSHEVLVLAVIAQQLLRVACPFDSVTYSLYRFTFSIFKHSVRHLTLRFLYFGCV